MKKFLYATPTKIIAFLLTTALLLIAAASCGLLFVLEIDNFYNTNIEQNVRYATHDLLVENVYVLWNWYEEAKFSTESSTPELDPNFYGKIVLVSSEKTVYEHGTLEPSVEIVRYAHPVTEDSGEKVWLLYEEQVVHDSTAVYKITGGCPANLQMVVSRGELYPTVAAVSALYTYKPVLYTIACISPFAFLLSLAFLFFLAGKSPSGETVLRGANRIPFDVFLGGFALCECGLSYLAFGLIDECVPFYNGSVVPFLLFCTFCTIAAGALLLIGLIYSFVARVKARNLFRSLLVVRIAVWCIKTLCRWIQNIATVPLVLGIVGAITVFNFVAGIAFDNFLFFLLLMGETVFFSALTVFVCILLAKLKKEAALLAAGDLSHKIETKGLIGPLKAHGENLNSIQQGMNAALQERIKSERMKTELITNVSHDIKTPLTSIVSYVDLLDKEELNETARGYVDILKRQSSRMKKLTEDVVEASRASSGAITLEQTPCNLNVLLEQTAGEFQEALQSKQVETKLSLPEEQLFVLADGKRLWRIFDNLLSNIVKYALPNTRAYLSLERKQDRAEIIFRNISKDALNMDPQELTERFVRGDRSRNSEGSGLGLSIARSLTEIQNGTFSIEIDGDLFKVTVTFPLTNKRPA